MNCYVCHRKGRWTPAVALCRVCSAGLCFEHVRSTATSLGPGGTIYTCQHDTWRPEALAPPSGA